MECRSNLGYKMIIKHLELIAIMALTFKLVSFPLKTVIAASASLSLFISSPPHVFSKIKVKHLQTHHNPHVPWDITAHSLLQQ